MSFKSALPPTRILRTVRSFEQFPGNETVSHLPKTVQKIYDLWKVKILKVSLLSYWHILFKQRSKWFYTKDHSDFEARRCLIVPLCLMISDVAHHVRIWKLICALFWGIFLFLTVCIFYVITSGDIS